MIEYALDAFSGILSPLRGDQDYGSEIEGEIFMDLFILIYSFPPFYLYLFSIQVNKSVMFINIFQHN